ncbi:MAG: MauE/DoxX family redox-associated membrane protein [Ornithinimicrobium sp.]
MSTGTNPRSGVPSGDVRTDRRHTGDPGDPTTGSPPERRSLDLLALVARLVLGGVLLVAGYLKVTDLNGSIQSVVAYDLFPYEVAKFIAITLPVVEIAVGALLILGLLTRVAAVVGTALMLIFVAGIASAWARGLAIDCGCFGTGGPVDPSATRYLEEILRDGALAVAGICLVLRPRSPLSVDRTLTRTGTATSAAPQERTD